ncbi:hypothetical protein LCGC14_0714630 [marine sediment metagenome]|uniref:DUF3168 domain-containing protein n=1 Tax=marine sediment metagenome TaxID=412755 RepID=A0A0F9QIK6_9ZZZZ|nr:hypothetical protein [Phycisphaerae bacterium]
MSLTRALIYELEQDSGVSGKVSDRIFIGRPSRESPTYPMLIVDLTDTQHVTTNDGKAGLAMYTYDIEVEARTYEELNDTAKTVRILLDGNTGDATFGETAKTVDVKSITLQGQSDSKDGPDDGSDRPVFVRTMTFDIWWAESTS